MDVILFFATLFLLIVLLLALMFTAYFRVGYSTTFQLLFAYIVVPLVLVTGLISLSYHGGKRIGQGQLASVERMEDGRAYTVRARAIESDKIVGLKLVDKNDFWVAVPNDQIGSIPHDVTLVRRSVLSGKVGSVIAVVDTESAADFRVGDAELGIQPVKPVDILP